MEAPEQLKALPDLLLPWFAVNHRDLPWRKTREPYCVWLSEIMLQQTRVEAVKGYYARFLEALPDIAHLANAPEDLLTKLWEGLGYYRRVYNLQTAAKQIMSTYSGTFPPSYDDIRALKGIGDYTAGAIASICFGQPTPAVDGNVLRVVTRLTDDHRPITAEKTKREIREALCKIYPIGKCGDFTQSLMELGATVCVPNGAPNCAVCPLRDICKSADGGWKDLPVKEAKKPRRAEDKTVFVLTCDGGYAVRKRSDSGLLAGLWEFPNVEGTLDTKKALTQAENWGVHPSAIEKTVDRTHIFTHVEWRMHCVYLQCRTRTEDFVWATKEQLEKEIALPTAFRMFYE